MGVETTVQPLQLLLTAQRERQLAALRGRQLLARREPGEHIPDAVAGTVDARVAVGGEEEDTVAVSGAGGRRRGSGQSDRLGALVLLGAAGLHQARNRCGGHVVVGAGRKATVAGGMATVAEGNEMEDGGKPSVARRCRCFPLQSNARTREVTTRLASTGRRGLIERWFD